MIFIKNINKKLVILFITALIFRLIIFFIINPVVKEGRENLLVGDAIDYHKIAVELGNGKGYSRFSPFLSMIRTPGYPFYLFFVYKIFGVNPWIAIIFQIVLDVCTSIILYFLIKSLWNKSAAIIGASIWAFHPFAVIYSNSLLSESMYVFTIIACFYFLVRFFGKGLLRYLIISAIFLAFSAYLRPISLYLIFIVTFLLFINNKSYSKKKFLTVFLYVIIFFILVSPWFIRNKIIHNHFFFSISNSFNSLVLYASPVISAQNNINKKEAVRIERNRIYKKYDYLYRTDPYEFYLKYKERAVEIIKANPSIFVKEYLWGIVDLYFTTEKINFERIFKFNSEPFNAIDELKSEGLIHLVKKIILQYHFYVIGYVILIIFFMFFEYLSSIIGIYLLIKLRKWKILLFVLMPILYFTFLIGPAGIGRFKLSIIPFYLIISAIAIDYLLNYYRTNLLKNK